MKFLFFAFLIVPIVEIYFLITIGSVIGVGLTIALIVLTAMLGALLVRAQGFSTIARVQGQLEKGEIPAVEILEGLFLLVAGALLLTPGFVTDAIGFACLTPPLRRWIIHRMLAARMLRGDVQSVKTDTGYSRQNVHIEGRVIEGEYSDIER
ncbi:MAG: FxsA family protein [Arenicellales bacterium]